MANNPVQIILNDRDFHQAPDPGQPPRNKDFFDKADTAFAAHKASLLLAIDAIIAQIRMSPYGPLAYIKVQMRSEALAKSYRPVWWLFKRDQFTFEWMLCVPSPSPCAARAWRGRNLVDRAPKYRGKRRLRRCMRLRGQ